MIVAEVIFILQGYKDGWMNGTKQILNDIYDMNNDTYKDVKELLTSNRDYTIIYKDDI